MGSTMKGLISACALVVALVLPASAAGTTYRLKGKVAGDANGTVTLKVVLRNGKPQRLKAFAYKNLDGFCNQDDTIGYETPAGQRSGNLGGSTRIDYGGAFMDVWYAPNPQRVGIFGYVRNRGNRVRATIEVYFNRNCKAGGRFTATRQR